MPKEQSAQNTAGYPKLKALTLAFLSAIPVAGFTVFYCFFHLVLRVPLNQLKLPYLIFSILSSLLAPGIYWARKQDTIGGGDDERLFFVLGGYLMLNTLVYIHFGVLRVLIPSSDAQTAYVITIITFPLISVGAFYFRKGLRGS